MSKSSPQRRKQQTRETNWLVVGGLIALGVIVFAGLLYLALRQPPDQAVQTLADYCDQNPDRCAASGPTDAPVTLVEVSDFGCTHCTTFHNETAEDLAAEFLEPGTIRWVALPYALSTTTVPAAAAAMCAGEQDRYFEFTNTMFTIDPVQTRLSPEGYQQAANAVGLDMEQFNSCMNDARFIDTVNANRDAARNVGVSGTPTFFINDEQLVGAQPLSVFAETINSLLN